MVSLILMLSLASFGNMSPMTMSIFILALSLTVSSFLYKSITMSWISFVLVITFSSGMMTLFMYASSLASNEINKMKFKMMALIVMVVYMVTPHKFSQKMMFTMKMFSSQTTLMILTSILLIAMLFISSLSWNPSQTLTTSF